MEHAGEAARNRYNKGCKVLVESGDLDASVTPWAVEKFKDEMNRYGIDWQFNNHFRTPGGFARAPFLRSSGYTEAADRRSTLSMLRLFAEVWPEVPQRPVEANACGTRLGQGSILSPPLSAAALSSVQKWRDEVSTHGRAPVFARVVKAGEPKL